MTKRTIAINPSPPMIATTPRNDWNARLLAAAVIVASFWMIGHTATHSRDLYRESFLDANRVENGFATQQKETTTSSAIGFFLLGGMGLACWATSSSEGINWRHPLLWFCAAYVAWCGASMLWSVDPVQTFRKLAILGLTLIGAYGAATRFDLDDVIAIALLTLGGFVGVGLLAELGLGMFRPWRGDYRFSGTCHPNDQAVQCAMLALAAIAAAWLKRDRPWLRMLLIAVGFVGLALTKSRTTLFALIAAMALAALLSAKGMQRWLVLSLGVAAICVIGIGANFVSVADIEQTFNVAAMGRREHLSSLTGRLPLWEEVWKAAEKRPLAGYGYGGFWGEKNVLKYSSIFAWHIPHAHNGFLDLMLAIGVFGGLLYLTWVVATGVVVAARHEASGDPAELFVVTLLTFSLFHAVTESKFPGAGIGPFLMMTAMAVIAIRTPKFPNHGLASDTWRGSDNGALSWPFEPSTAMPAINANGDR